MNCVLTLGQAPELEGGGEETTLLLKNLENQKNLKVLEALLETVVLPVVLETETEITILQTAVHQDNNVILALSNN